VDWRTVSGRLDAREDASTATRYWFGWAPVFEDIFEEFERELRLKVLPVRIFIGVQATDEEVHSDRQFKEFGLKPLALLGELILLPVIKTCNN